LFRGHSKSEYPLCTTLSRFTPIPHEDWSSGIDEILESFRAGLVKLVVNPIDTNSRLDWMEYARHHGVPTPCIDFSYSPYVALFFAFNGVRKKYPKPEKPEYSVEKQKEPDESLPDGSTEKGMPTLKVYIDQQCVSEVFSKLELMGVTGGTLYMDPNGVVLDVINSYNYNQKTQYLRGVTFTDIDESKLHK